MEIFVIIVLILLVTTPVTYWYLRDDIDKWRYGGPIKESSLAETALLVTEAHKSYMELSARLEKQIIEQRSVASAQQADMDAAHARIMALKVST